jgi:hypothetical protein
MTAFVVDTNQQILAHLLDAVAQGRELVAALPVAGKQNHATHQRVLEALLVLFAQAQTSNVDDQGGVQGHDVLPGKLLDALNE